MTVWFVFLCIGELFGPLDRVSVDAQTPRFLVFAWWNMSKNIHIFHWLPTLANLSNVKNCICQDVSVSYFLESNGNTASWCTYYPTTFNTDYFVSCEWECEWWDLNQCCWCLACWLVGFVVLVVVVAEFGCYRTGHQLLGFSFWGNWMWVITFLKHY